jgi:hypothetical protein
MKIYTKILSVILVLGMAMSVLASCGDTGAGKNDVDDGKYKINVSIIYATNDNKLKDAISAVGTNGATVMVDGDNMAVYNTVVVGNTSVNESYVLFDNMLYRDMTVIANGNSATVQEKSDFHEENRQHLLADLGVGADVSVFDFKILEITSMGENDCFNCTDINADSAESLEKIFGAGLSGVGATVSLDSAEYQEIIHGETIIESTLSCHFIILLGGVSYELTVHMNYDYDYSAEVSVTAPEGADGYNTVTYNEIIK